MSSFARVDRDAAGLDGHVRAVTLIIPDAQSSGLLGSQFLLNESTSVRRSTPSPVRSLFFRGRGHSFLASSINSVLRAAGLRLRFRDAKPLALLLDETLDHRGGRRGSVQQSCSPLRFLLNVCDLGIGRS
jgi:hypothetical protein